VSALPSQLPELIDARGIQAEMDVKRTVAERIIEQVPKQTIPGVRRLLVRRSDVQALLDRNLQD
jgi:hypothetical protein